MNRFNLLLIGLLFASFGFGQEGNRNLFEIENQFIKMKGFEHFSVDQWAFDMDSSDYYGNHVPHGCTAPIKTEISFKDLCERVLKSECDLTDQINPWIRNWEKENLNFKINRVPKLHNWWNHFVGDFINLFTARNRLNIGKAIKIDENNYLIQYYLTNKFYRITQNPKLALIHWQNGEITEIKEY